MCYIVVFFSMVDHPTKAYSISSKHWPCLSQPNDALSKDSLLEVVTTIGSHMLTLDIVRWRAMQWFFIPFISSSSSSSSSSPFLFLHESIKCALIHSRARILHYPIASSVLVGQFWSDPCVPGARVWVHIPHDSSLALGRSPTHCRGLCYGLRTGQRHEVRWIYWYLFTLERVWER